MDLRNFFTPKSIAVVGASRDENKVGSVIVKNVIKAGFRGSVFPVNPNASHILGLKAFPRVSSIPERVDLAVIAVPARFTPEVIEDCGKAGVRDVLMVTAGFSEIGDKEMERKLLLAVERYGIRLIGPNCLGVIDSHSGVDLIFLPSIRLKRPPRGGISFVCQSGAVGSATLDVIAKQGLGFSKFVSYGNASVVNETDILEYLSTDERTKVICMYVEGVKDGRRFMEVARRVVKKKPIVVLKGGLTEKGAHAALSHTASLAGSAEVYEGVFKQVGIVEAKQLDELFNFAKVLEKSMKPKGRRVQVITNGGGFGILCMDGVERDGLESADLSSKTLEWLKKKLPKECTVANPLDLTGSATTDQYGVALDACVNDANVDVILLVTLFQTPLIEPRIVDIVSRFHKMKKKPIIVLATGGDFTEVLKGRLEAKGLPCFTYPNEAVDAIKALCAYYKV